MKLFDIIFPPSEDMVRVRTLTTSSVIDKYRKRCTKEGIVYLASYSDEDMRALIHETKFHGSRKSSKLLGLLLTCYLEETGSEYDAIVPIPLPGQRRRKRGFNQVEEVLFETKTPIPIEKKVLTRTNTKPQTELGRKERLHNLKDAFNVRRPMRIEGKRILLIDDVTTTGTTLSEARKALKKANPASITLLALAH